MNAPVSLMNTCPACQGKHLTSLYRVDDIPVQSCVLLESQQEALAFPRHAIHLMCCQRCGFVFNAAFDQALLDYRKITEESQHYSDTFGRFACELVEEIVEHRDLADGQVLEIGCGKGDFLRELCGRAQAHGLGIDPGFLPNRTGQQEPVSFIKDYFRPDQLTMEPDLIVCRHTLEHISPVAEFIGDIADLIGRRNDVCVFFETPDAKRVLAEGAFWDIYFEHCSYFTMGTHARLFRQAGLAVTDIRLGYGDQYIIQYAEPAGREVGPPLPQEDDLGEIDLLIEAFPDQVSRVREHWRSFVDERQANDKRIVVWGGGSKAVSFLTTLGLNGEIAEVVDINPFKQNKYLPASGHQVVAPETLADAPPDCVIVMNPIYLGEIGSSLTAMGLKPEIVAV